PKKPKTVEALILHHIDDMDCQNKYLLLQSLLKMRFWTQDGAGTTDFLSVRSSNTATKKSSKIRTHVTAGKAQPDVAVYLC
ncbi:MAG: hypothetical protein LRY51_12265, partial [Geovibrio sp.]|nr:hypothetical protein [Geovibrio sp.]